MTGAHDLVERLRALFGRATVTRPPCRLTDAEALALAREALGGRMPLFVSGVSAAADGVVWTVGTATIGSGCWVSIDDATDTVLECRRWGVR